MNFSKYHAKPVTIDGIRFASKKEGSRYCELKALTRAGKISDLQLQVPFILSKAHRRTGEKRMTSGKNTLPTLCITTALTNGKSLKM